MAVHVQVTGGPWAPAEYPTMLAAALALLEAGVRAGEIGPEALQRLKEPGLRELQRLIPVRTRVLVPGPRAD